MNYAYAKLPAQDIQRARAFYEQALGLTPFGSHNDHLWYEVGGAHFIVYPSSGAPSGTHDQVGFVVDDIDAQATALRESGVDLGEGVKDMGAVKALWFHDSEGNLLSMAEFAAGSPFTRGSESAVA